jgi:hypothetical protein
MRLQDLAVLSAMVLPTACSSNHDADARFAAVQERGRQVMGVDQYTSTHVFESLPDGGRIELQRDTADSADIAQIRKHMQEISVAFGAGDFRLPGMVHDMEVAGTRTMAEERAAIRYQYRPLLRGGEVRITALNARAIEAVHQFLAFQRMDHRAHGH